MAKFQYHLRQIPLSSYATRIYTYSGGCFRSSGHHNGKNGNTVRRKSHRPFEEREADYCVTSTLDLPNADSTDGEAEQPMEGCGRGFFAGGYGCDGIAASGQTARRLPIPLLSSPDLW